MGVISWILRLLWFFLPVALANMAPVLIKDHWRSLAKPIDGGKHVFGNHKTWRGLLVATVSAGLLFLIQWYLGTHWEFFQTIAAYVYTDFPWWFGFVFGLFAILGDLVKSFFKRRFHIADGASWFPFDQVDFLVGALLALELFIDVDVLTWVLALSLGISLHILVNRIGFRLHFKTTPW